MIKHTQIICWLYFSLWNIFDGSSARIISLVELSIDSLSDKIPIYYKWHYEWHFQNKEHHIWVKVIKNGPSKICGRKPVKFWSDTVCLSRPYHFKFFKGCLPQILFGPFLTYITLEIVHYGSETIAWLGLKIWYADIWGKQKIQEILTSLNQILNSTNQRIVRAVCVNLQRIKFHWRAIRLLHFLKWFYIWIRFFASNIYYFNVRIYSSSSCHCVSSYCTLQDIN